MRESNGEIAAFDVHLQLSCHLQLIRSFVWSTSHVTPLTVRGSFQTRCTCCLCAQRCVRRNTANYMKCIYPRSLGGELTANEAKCIHWKWISARSHHSRTLFSFWQKKKGKHLIFCIQYYAVGQQFPASHSLCVIVKPEIKHPINIVW